MIKSNLSYNTHQCAGDGMQRGPGGQGRRRPELLCPGLTLRFGTHPGGPNFTACQLEAEHRSREAGRREDVLLPCSQEPDETSN